MRPIDGDEAIRAIPKWKRYGVDEEGKLSEWKTGSPAYVNLEEVLDTIATMPTIDISTGWIPVMERLPEEDGTYLVSMCYPREKGTNSDFMAYSTDLKALFEEYRQSRHFDGSDGGGWYVEEADFMAEEYSLVDFTRFVIAWMPLPEPYRKEEK